MKQTDTKSRLWPLAGIAWLACWLGGCACHGECHTVDYSCYSVWPCFGFNSTCWRPWPEECVTCPSPYAAFPLKGELLPGAPLPESPTPELPMPMPPLPVQPMPEASPAPANPPASIRPQSYEAPLAEGPSELAPIHRGETSSRRRSLEANYSLDSLRWAPTDNP